MRIGLTKAMRAPVAPKPERKPVKYYVLTFIDDGFDSVAAGPFKTRKEATPKAKELRAEQRDYNRENPRNRITFYIESTRTMPFDPEGR